MSNTVLFDLDDTILDFHECEKRALTAVLKKLGIKATAERIALYSEINDKMWKKLERGEATREVVLTERFAEFFAAVNADTDAELGRAEYEKQLSEQAVFIPGDQDMLERLYKKYDLYIVSNGTSHVQAGRIAKAGIAKYFKDIFISHNIGVNKPDVRFFEYCAAHIGGFERERTVIVGDSPSSDIQGGKNFKIATVRFDPHFLPALPEADRVIHSLDEIDGVLECFFKNGRL